MAIAHGQRAPTPAAGLTGSWGCITSVATVRRAYAALGAIIGATIGAFAGMTNTAPGDFGLADFAGSTFTQLGFHGCASVMGQILVAFGEEARALRTDRRAPPSTSSASWPPGPLRSPRWRRNGVSTRELTLDSASKAPPPPHSPSAGPRISPPQPPPSVQHDSLRELHPNALSLT